ncbi:MAG: deaminase [Bacteroidota bacterium]
MKILTKQELETSIDLPKVLAAIEQGFVWYSQGQAVIPPIGSMHFPNPPGECHIKYGYLREGRFYVVKVASGFPKNREHGLPAGNGLLTLFDQHTGQPVALFLDEGFLTDMRTAAAGCIAAKYLAPQHITAIGIVGTGAQAFYQLKLLRFATHCRKVMVWGRSFEKAQRLQNHPDLQEWDIEAVKNLQVLCSTCNLIVTTTSSDRPLLFANQIRKGTHITAVGADDVEKQELDPAIFSKAGKTVVDSKNQCMQFGEVALALKQQALDKQVLIELGEVILDPSKRRKTDDEITVVCLTGVAIQDLQIATTFLAK